MTVAGLKLNGEFFRNAIAAMMLTGTAIGFFVSIKSDIAVLQVQVANIHDDLSDLQRDFNHGPSSTSFTAIAR